MLFLIVAAILTFGSFAGFVAGREAEKAAVRRKVARIMARHNVDAPE